MRKTNQFWIMLVLLGAILQACNTVYFREAQPAGEKNLNTFPGKLVGTYSLKPEEEKVIITPDSVLLEEFLVHYISKREVDSLKTNGKLQELGDSLLITDSEEDRVMRFAYDDLGDSLRLRQMEMSVITLSDTSVLRKKKGSWYLSLYEEDKGLWEVLRIDLLSGDRLLVRHIGEDGVGIASGYMELDTLDSRDYVANPPAKAFLEFSKQDGFSDTLFYLPRMR